MSEELRYWPSPEPGMPEAGVQPSMLPEEVAGREVRPPARADVVQISMEDQLKLDQARKAAEEEEEEERTSASFTAKDREHLFGVSGLADIGEAEDLSDLVEVDDEDLFGVEETEPQPKPQPRKVLYRRTSRPYTPPDTSMKGLRD